MKNRLDKEFIDNMSKDPGNWRGMIYYNRKDHRLIVPKLYPSLGWTFNFANPITYVALAAIIAVIIVAALIF